MFSITKLQVMLSKGIVDVLSVALELLDHSTTLSQRIVDLSYLTIQVARLRDDVPPDPCNRGQDDRG